MVTLDNILARIGEFKGDSTRENKNYERATQGLKAIKPVLEMFDALFAHRSGYDLFNPPEGKKTVNFTVACASVGIDAVLKTQKPAYEKIFRDVERHISTLGYFALQGDQHPGVTLHEKQPYLQVDGLWRDARTIVAGYILPEVAYAVRVEHPELEKFDQVSLPQSVRSLNEQNLLLYGRLRILKEEYGAFVKAYKAKLPEDPQEEGEETVQVTNDLAQGVQKQKVSKVKWGDAVKTIMIGDKNDDAELEQLCETGISVDELQEEHDWADLKDLIRKGEKGRYVSAASVYTHMFDLLGENQPYDRMLAHTLRVV